MRIVRAVAATVLLLSGCSDTSSQTDAPEALPTTFTVTGVVTIVNQFGDNPGRCELLPVTDYSGRVRCAKENLRYLTAINNGKSFPAPDGPGGGYEDLHDGTQVVVRDGENNVLGTGELSNGTFNESGTVFDFSVPDVPESDFYQVEVGQRGATTYAKDELEGMNWTLALEIG